MKGEHGFALFLSRTEADAVPLQKIVSGVSDFGENSTTFIITKGLGKY